MTCMKAITLNLLGALETFTYQYQYVTTFVKAFGTLERRTLYLILFALDVYLCIHWLTYYT